MSLENIFSLCFSGGAPVVSLISIAIQIYAHLATTFKLDVKVVEDESFIIDPMHTRNGNCQSVLLCLSLINRSVYPITIDSIGLCKPHPSRKGKFCYSIPVDEEPEHPHFTIFSCDETTEWNPERRYEKFPLRLEGYDSKTIYAVCSSSFCTGEEEYERVTIEVVTARKTIRLHPKLSTPKGRKNWEIWG